MFAYITHKNLAVRRSMKAMRSAYSTPKTGLGLKTSQTNHDANDHGTYASCVKGKRASFTKNILVVLKCGIRFSISFRWYAFPNFRTQISRPLAYSVRISSKASATADFILVFLLYVLLMCFSSCSREIENARDQCVPPSHQDEQRDGFV